jgi:hypothetical protein
MEIMQSNGLRTLKTNDMTDCEYILKQAKLFHYKGWDEEEMRKCVDMLVGLSRQELIVLYTSRWLAGVKPIREEIFKILYMDRIGKRDERVKDLSTNQLINEFEERKGGNIAILRQELRHRFIECLGDDRIKITAAFNRATKGDRMWVELQIRKEQSLGKLPF